MRRGRLGGCGGGEAGGRAAQVGERRGGSGLGDGRMGRRRAAIWTEGTDGGGEVEGEGGHVHRRECERVPAHCMQMEYQPVHGHHVRSRVRCAVPVRTRIDRLGQNLNRPLSKLGREERQRVQSAGPEMSCRPGVCACRVLPKPMCSAYARRPRPRKSVAGEEPLCQTNNGTNPARSASLCPTGSPRQKISQQVLNALKSELRGIRRGAEMSATFTRGMP